uniref:Centriolar satellite-associated tubulin polyglutamylase complex regulator 1 n=1 Tax=Cyprinus carpio TaxID=7962 RepID=A0A8C2FSA6_CYPCA
MKMNTDRFNLTVDEYLAETNVLYYLNDAVTQLLEHKDEYTQFGVVRYFAEYFTSVKNGNHVLFREFSYIKATSHNRESFIHIFWKCFRQIGKNGDLLAMAEYSSLLQLLCPDFPTEMVQNAARIVLTEDATDCLMSFSDFIYSFQIQLFFEEYVNILILTKMSGLCNSNVMICRFPSTVAVKEILESSQRVSFYGFLMALAKHEGVNQDIGALPNKSDLLIDPEMDQELERLIAQVAISPTSNSSSSAAGQKETSKKASPRKSLHQRKRIEMESDGSTEETDSSEN